MRLITSAATLDFLSKGAPRPWVKRMLKWMIYEGELTPYFTNGKIVPYARVLGVLLQVKGLAEMEPGPERDAAIRENFEEDISNQLVGRGSMEEVFDDPIQWNEEEEPHGVGAGFFVYSEDLDWESGTIRADISAPESRDEIHLFWDADDHLGSQFSRADFRAELSGLCFSFDAIEMLLPSADSGIAQATVSRPEATIGRPRKWDWEGAFAKLAVVAQHPDGLPTGPGAQARIERILADWFVAETGESPASSQIRQRAQKMIRLLSVPKA